MNGDGPCCYKTKEDFDLAKKQVVNKWEEIVYKNGTDLGSRNCAFCKRYFSYDCLLCPINVKTRRRSCHNTPYDDWRNHHEQNHFYPYDGGNSCRCDTCRKLAKEMLEFLKSLTWEEYIGTNVVNFSKGEE